MTYLRHGVNTKQRDAVVAEAVAKLTPIADTFDAIAFRGVSGALVAPIVAYLLKKDVLVVRKPRTDETSHSYLTVEGTDAAAPRYLIVDDLIATGKTVDAIIDAVYQSRSKAECVGVYCYNDDAPRDSVDTIYTESGKLPVMNGEIPSDPE